MTETSITPMGPEDFRKVMAPTVTAIRELTDAVKANAARHADTPSVDSRAMRELAAEAGYVATCPDWTGPIRDAHSLGGVTLLAACDCARGFAELFDTPATPMYGHLVIARSVLEAAVVSRWLNDPDASYDERVKRALADLIYSAKELKRLGFEDKTTSVGRLTRWTDVADTFGWEVGKATKPTVDRDGRPEMADGINKLLLKEGEWKLGSAQWGYLSSVSHATWYGLAQSVLEPPKDSILAQVAGFGTASTSVFAQAVCVMGAVRNAATARFTLMGWMDDDWRAAGKASIGHETQLIKTFPVPPTDDTDKGEGSGATALPNGK